MVERVAEGLGDDVGPGLELLVGRGLPGDVGFGDPGCAHGPPFVVVALQPEGVEVGEAAVVGHVGGRKVVVVINDGLVRGDLVIEALGGGVVEQEVVGDEGHGLKGRKRGKGEEEKRGSDE